MEKFFPTRAKIRANKKMDSTAALGIGNKQLPKGCCEMISDKFDLDSEIQVETSQQSNVSGFVRPIAGLEGGSPYSFKLEPVGDTWLQMNSMYFYVQCQVTTSAGAEIADTAKVGLVSAFGMSFFKTLQVNLNDFQINPGTDLDMPYKNYIETMLSSDTVTKNTHLSSSIFDLDDMNKLDNMDATDSTNKPFANRAKRITKSKVFDFCVPVYSDFFRSDNHLAPGNSLFIKATKNSDDFLLKTTEDSPDYKIVVKDVRLYYNRIRLDPTLTTSVIKSPERYTCAQTTLKRFVLPSGLSSYNMEVFNGNLPKSIVVAMVKTTASDGSMKENPFNIQHFNVNRVTLRVNGQSVPSDGYNPRFSEDLYAKEYASLFLNTGMWRGDRASSISYERYKKGSTFFVFDLSPDLCNNSHFHETRSGVIDLELQWKSELTNPITLLIYAVQNQTITVEGNKEPARIDLI